jgi:hypothetical protein
MDDNLWRVRRWAEAEETGQEEDADAACRAVFAAVSAEPAIGAEFTAATLRAIAAAHERDRRRALRVRRATVAAGAGLTAVLAYVAGPWALVALWNGFLGLIELVVGITVRIAVGVQAGADVWTILAGMGRAAAAFAADPAITIAMLAMQAVAMAALIALRRLLESDRESLE